MAGTGHAYEIANLDDVRTLLERHQASLLHDDCRSWLRSKGVTRALTSERLTIPVDSQRLGVFMRLEGYLLTKIEDRLARKADDGLVRIFSPNMLMTAGIDLGHLCDWLNAGAYGEQADRFLRKLARTTLDVAVRKADEWTSSLARAKAREEIRIGPVLDLGDGYVWVELLNGAALQHESASMRHCVGDVSYRRLVEAGTATILSLRDASGWPQMTVHLEREPESDDYRVGQVRGFGNSTGQVQHAYRLLALLDHFTAHPRHRPDDGALSDYDLEFDAGAGRWRHLDEFFLPKTIAGIECRTDGRILRVVLDGLTCATLAGWSSIEGESDAAPGRTISMGFLSISFLGRDTLEARRAACTVAGQMTFVHWSSDSDLLAGSDRAKPSAWEDTDEYREVAGVPVRIRVDGRQDVHLSPTVVATLRPNRSFSQTHLEIDLRQDLGLDNARRLVAVLNEMDVRFAFRDAPVSGRDHLRRSGIERHSASPWFVERDLARTTFPGSNGGRWVRTTWTLDLVDDASGRTLHRVDLAGDEVANLGFSFSHEKCRDDMIRILNRLRIGSSPSRLTYLSERDRSPIVHSGGRWHLVRRRDKIVRLIEATPVGERLAPELRAMGLRMLRPDADAPERRALARCLVERFVEGHQWLFASPSTSYRQEDPVEDLLRISHLWDEVPPASRKALGKAITAAIPPARRRAHPFPETRLDALWILTRFADALGKAASAKLKRITFKNAYVASISLPVSQERSATVALQVVAIEDWHARSGPGELRSAITWWANECVANVRFWEDGHVFSVHELTCIGAWSRMGLATKYTSSWTVEKVRKAQELVSSSGAACNDLEQLARHLEGLHEERERANRAQRADVDRLIAA